MADEIPCRLYIQRTSEDIKTPVNVYIKYHARIATKLTLEKQVELLGYGYRNTDRKSHNVVAWRSW